MPKDRQIVLIAPNLSEQIGGEGIKALQIFLELRKRDPDTIQITHERNEKELEQRLGLKNVFYVRDDWVSLFLWHSVVFRWFLDVWFSYKAVKLAEFLISTEVISAQGFIIHQTEPNSPVVLRSTSRHHLNVFGPINGNIYYPEMFRSQEKLRTKLRRIFHFPAQWCNRVLRGGIGDVQQILVAGGERTRQSLIAAGCAPVILIDTLDCGIPDAMLDRKRVAHEGENFRFIHFGRLVFHKGTQLAIESLCHTRNPVCLDIVGTGPELEVCQQLVNQLGLDRRVRFLDWHESHADLFDSFKDYRGVVLPTIEDANGIVIQEAMALGLPAICLDWGGPQLLVDHELNGFLISPVSKDYILKELAKCMDRLGENGALAESFSVSGREKAELWRWSSVAETWMNNYPDG